MPLTIPDYILSFSAWGIVIIPLFLSNLLFSFFDFRFVSMFESEKNINIPISYILNEYKNNAYSKRCLGSIQNFFRKLFFLLLVLMLVDQSFLDVFSVKYYYIVILLFFIVYQIFIMIFLDKKSIFIMVIVCYNVVMMLTLLFVINETINIFDGKNDKINIYNKEYVLLRSFDNGYLAYDNDFKYIYFITRSNNIIIKYDFPKDFKPELNILNEEAWINIDKNMEKILKDSLSVIPSIR